MNEIVKANGNGNLEPLSIKELVGQVRLIQEAMRSVMKENVHYGKIPGCGSKPSLLKAGAEKLCFLFRLYPKFEILPESLITSESIKYVVRCELYHMTGAMNGSGIGSCSTAERKYWKSDPVNIENTVIKMAQKRALVAAALVATAASDIFTQDIEDLPKELFEGEGGNGSRQPHIKPQIVRDQTSCNHANELNDPGDYAKRIIVAQDPETMKAIANDMDCDYLIPNNKRNALILLWHEKAATLGMDESVVSEPVASEELF